MNIWLALWLILSLTLMAFLAWSLVISFQQKRAWKAFAQKHDLRFKPGRLNQSPEMDGLIEDYRFNFFSGEHAMPDMRATRKMTAIEVVLHGVLPVVEGALASGGMVPLAKGLNFKTELLPKHENWNKSYIAITSHKNVLELYLTEERLQALTKLMQINNLWTIFIFRHEMALLRLDTPNALTSTEQIDKLSKLLLKTAKILELKPGEAQMLKAEEARTPIRETAIAIDEEALTSGALSLEDDEGKPA